MTWEELGKKYEQSNKAACGRDRTPRLRKNWEDLVKSTDKLIWLFSVSNGGKAQRKAE